MSNPDLPGLLFQMGQALIEVSKEVDADESGAGQTNNQVEHLVNSTLESHKSQAGFDLAIKQLLGKIKALKSAKNASGESAKDTPGKQSLRDAIRELGISLDVSGMNHMNLPISTWVEQDMDSRMNTELLDKQSMQSALMTQLLQEWSSDENKILYLLNWTECLRAGDKEHTGAPPPLPEAFPQGLQVVGLTPLLKEGFLLYLVPVVRHLSVHRLRVFLRRRLRDEASHQSILTGSQNFDFLYDLRIKVVPPEGPVAAGSKPSTGSAAAAAANPAPAAASGGWFSSLMPQSGPFASIIDWANGPASDNSFVDKMEAETGHARRRSNSYYSNSSSGAVPLKSEEEHAQDRAWSQGVSESSGGRSRVSSTDSSGSNLSATARAIQTELEQYEMDLPLSLTSAYTAPPILSRGNSGTNRDSSDAAGSYLAPSIHPVATQPAAAAAVPNPPPSAPTAKLSLVEAKLAKLRNSSEAKKK